MDIFQHSWYLYRCGADFKGTNVPADHHGCRLLNWVLITSQTTEQFPIWPQSILNELLPKAVIQNHIHTWLLLSWWSFNLHLGMAHIYSQTAISKSVPEPMQWLPSQGPKITDMILDLVTCTQRFLQILSFDDLPCIVDDEMLKVFTILQYGTLFWIVP